jgi:hypothetical protein
MPVVKTTSPAWDRGLPKDQPEYSYPSSSTNFACRCCFAMISFPPNWDHHSGKKRNGQGLRN